MAEFNTRNRMFKLSRWNAHLVNGRVIELHLPSQIDSKYLSLNTPREVIGILEDGHEVKFCIR